MPMKTPCPEPSGPRGTSSAITDWQKEIDRAKQDTTNHGVFKLDLNQFLQQQGRLKVVMRKID